MSGRLNNGQKFSVILSDLCVDDFGYVGSWECLAE